MRRLLYIFLPVLCLGTISPAQATPVFGEPVLMAQVPAPPMPRKKKTWVPMSAKQAAKTRERWRKQEERKYKGGIPAPVKPTAANPSKPVAPTKPTVAPATATRTTKATVKTPVAAVPAAVPAAAATQTTLHKTAASQAEGATPHTPAPSDSLGLDAPMPAAKPPAEKPGVPTTTAPTPSLASDVVVVKEPVEPEKKEEYAPNSINWGGIGKVGGLGKVGGP